MNSQHSQGRIGFKYLVSKMTGFKPHTESGCQRSVKTRTLFYERSARKGWGVCGRSQWARAKSENRLLTTGFGITQFTPAKFKKFYRIKGHSKAYLVL